MKVIEHGFDEIIKADLELTDTNEDLIKKGMFSRKKNQTTENGLENWLLVSPNHLRVVPNPFYFWNQCRKEAYPTLNDSEFQWRSFHRFKMDREIHY